MNIRPLLIVIIAASIITAGCTGIRPAEAPKKNVITQASLVSHLRTIQTIAPHLGELDAEFARLPQPGELGRDYYNARETDEIEGLLFRFLAIQTTLWDTVDSYGGLDADFPADEIDTKAHVLSITATLLLASHTAFVVAQFADQPMAIKQLNEAYFRSEIPFGSYDRMRVNATAPDLLKSVSQSKALYVKEMADPQFCPGHPGKQGCRVCRPHRADPGITGGGRGASAAGRKVLPIAQQNRKPRQGRLEQTTQITVRHSILSV